MGAGDGDPRRLSAAGRPPSRPLHGRPHGHPRMAACSPLPAGSCFPPAPPAASARQPRAETKPWRSIVRSAAKSTKLAAGACPDDSEQSPLRLKEAVPGAGRPLAAPPSMACCECGPGSPALSLLPPSRAPSSRNQHMLCLSASIRHGAAGAGRGPVTLPVVCPRSRARRSRRACRRPRALSEDQLHLVMPLFTPEEQWALTLTTFAGLSTSLGAAFAVSPQCLPQKL